MLSNGSDALHCHVGRSRLSAAFSRLLPLSPGCCRSRVLPGRAGEATAPSGAHHSIELPILPSTLMNWTRVLLYTGLLYVATFLAGFVPGVIRGFYTASGSAPPSWLPLLQGGLSALALFLVFHRLGRVQRECPWTHAAAVWLGVVALLLLNVFLGQSVAQLLAGIVPSAPAAAGMGMTL